MKNILVTGAGGFIGHHLVKFLKAKGLNVRGVDIKEPDFEKSTADEFKLLDLRDRQAALESTTDIDTAFCLAANMGGIGHTHDAPAEILHDNLLISTLSLEACRINKVKKILYTSSACVYPNYLQESNTAKALEEDKIFPADPDMEYGWEKLTSEILHSTYQKTYGLNIRIARLHNIYGPLGTYEGGREKSPAALCRKTANLPEYGGEVEVWGDGSQARSYCYIDDCIIGIWKIMSSESLDKPVNLGSDRMVTINELLDIIAKTSGKKVTYKYELSKPVGPMGRCSDNKFIKKSLGWSPEISLEDGLSVTYRWISNQLKKNR